VFLPSAGKVRAARGFKREEPDYTPDGRLGIKRGFMAQGNPPFERSWEEIESKDAGG
jgi:hypothetical protein